MSVLVHVDVCVLGTRELCVLGTHECVGFRQLQLWKLVSNVIEKISFLLKADILNEHAHSGPL